MGKRKRNNEELLQQEHTPDEAELEGDYNPEEVERDIQDTINRAEGNFLQKNGVGSSESKNEAPKETVSVIDEKTLQQALETLKAYKKAKTNFNQRVIDNEQWWKLRHWEQMRTGEQSTEPTSAWLFNSIMNKLADFSDNIPEANIRARAEADVEEAERIKNILPMIIEANDYEGTYMDVCLSKIKNGTGITGVFWNKDKDDIDIQQVDVLSIYWQPGIKDIQASRNIFTVELVDNDLLKELYPDKEIKSGDDITTSAKYLYEDNIDTSEKSAVIDWYYKKNGVLHFCKFVNTTVLFSTENDPETYPNGLYDDGNYPFVVDTLFKMEGTIAGFGYLDVCKSPQEYIDKLDQAIIQNAFMCARPRYFIRNDSSINSEEFLNWKNPLVKTSGNLGEDDLRQIIIKQLDAGVYSARDGKINELKQTSGNSDVNTGTSANGVTAASAISQLIETGSKGSRHAIKGTYRAYRRIVYMIIERMRQFYNEARYVRITDEAGNDTYETYDNSGLVEQSRESVGGETVYRLPQFDIEVSAQKASPYNKMNQNELALQFYQIGFFNPQNTDMALACLNMMDFEHKQEIIKQIKENGTMLDIIQQQQQQLAQFQGVADENGKLRVMTDIAYGSNLAGGQPESPEEIAQIDRVENSLNEGDGSNSMSEQRRKQAAGATEV